MQAQSVTIPQFSPLEEQAVGITEYITKGRQIPAITKYLLSDFIVNEIDQQGNVVVVENRPQNFKFVREEKKPPNYQVTEELSLEMRKQLGEETAKEIQSLYERLQSGQKLYKWDYYMNNVPKEKSQRLRIHTFIRQKLQNIESTTQENKIKLKFNPKLRKTNPQFRHKYIHFKLFKSNIDTMSALFKLSKITGISQKILSTAGLKDKRGITTQMVSVYNTEVYQLNRFFEQADRNRQIWIDGIVEFKDDAIAVGCLQGNQFGLVLRLLRAEDAQQVQKRVKKIQEYGIINYFGMQRFGSCATKTHLIGVKLIKKQYKELVEQLLLQDTGSQNLNNLKREFYENKQYNKGDRALGSKYKIEKALFQGLAKYGQNYYNVFENLPRSMKTLYCHALQSYVWNLIISRRLREHGLKLVEGDIVGVKKGNNASKKEEQSKLKEDKVQQKVQEKQIQAQELQQAEDDEQLQIVLITKDNINNYSFADLVAPLYGVSINLPEQSIMNAYLEQELEKLQLKKTDFQDRSKALCFKGAYRKCIIRPGKIQCIIVQHKQKKAELLSPFYMSGDKLEYEKGDLKSAVIIVQLPKSSYATIAIRQILHIPSSFKVQTQLNNLYEKI